MNSGSSEAKKFGSTVAFRKLFRKPYCESALLSKNSIAQADFGI